MKMTKLKKVLFITLELKAMVLSRDFMLKVKNLYIVTAKFVIKCFSSIWL